MALNTTRSLSQLKAECSSLGLTVSHEKAKNGKEKVKKEDYILALRNHYLKEKYGSNIPPHLSLILNIESPMLCKRIQELPPSEQEHLWTSPSIIAEQKEDGVRILIVHTPEGFHLYSRNLSVTDFLPTDYIDKVPLNLPPIQSTFILDCECISTNPHVNTILNNHGVITESQLQAVTAILAMNPTQSHLLQRDCPLQFRVFDCLYHNQWLLNEPLRYRKKVAYNLQAYLKSLGMNIEHTLTNISHKKAFFNHLISEGKEGVVLKDLNSPYNPTTSRAHGWVKAKRTVSLSKDIDCFVTGFIPSDPTKSWAGQIGGLSLSVYLEDGSIHEIANVTNIPQQMRIEMTTTGPDGQPTLKQEYYGRCCTVDGQSISSRARRLRHAVFVQWRPDKSPLDCQLTNDFLNSLIL